MYVCVCTFVCVYVCVCERERECVPACVRESNSVRLDTCGMIHLYA